MCVGNIHSGKVIPVLSMGACIRISLGTLQIYFKLKHVLICCVALLGRVVNMCFGMLCGTVWACR